MERCGDTFFLSPSCYKCRSSYDRPTSTPRRKVMSLESFGPVFFCPAVSRYVHARTLHLPLLFFFLTPCLSDREKLCETTEALLHNFLLHRFGIHRGGLSFGPHAADVVSLLKNVQVYACLCTATTTYTML